MPGRMADGPPLARALLSLLLAAEDRRFALTDLDEDLERDAASLGARTARRRYTAQVPRSVLPGFRLRLIHVTPWLAARRGCHAVVRLDPAASDLRPDR